MSLVPGPWEQMCEAGNHRSLSFLADIFPTAVDDVVPADWTPLGPGLLSLCPANPLHTHPRHSQSKFAFGCQVYSIPSTGVGEIKRGPIDNTMSCSQSVSQATVHGGCYSTCSVAALIAITASAGGLCIAWPFLLCGA